MIEPLEARIAPAALSTIDLISLNGTNGFKILDHLGETFGGPVNNFLARAGLPVSAGDVNGDGFDDLIFGASGAAAPSVGAGAAYVVFGRAGGFPAALDVTNLDGTDGFKIQGGSPGEYLGSSVSPAGDVNGDGFADLLVAAGLPSDFRSARPAVSYVIFGHGGHFTPVFNLASLDGTNGFKIVPEASEQFTGVVVSAAGDVNGDGLADIITAAEGFPLGNDTFLPKPTYVIFGKDTGFDSTFSLASLDGTNGFKMVGPTNTNRADQTVSSAGDLNGDGLADLLIGAKEGVRDGPFSNNCYVVFGQKTAFSTPLDLSTLDGTAGFKISINRHPSDPGLVLCPAGDLNADGIDDLSLGAKDNSYVVYGKKSAFSPSLNLATLDSADGFKTVGTGVKRAGDVNGDGLGDFLVETSGNPDAAGKSRVVFGTAAGFDPTRLSSLDGTNGFMLGGDHTFDDAGWSVRAAGDVNGDGFADLLVAGFGPDSHGNRTGVSYLVFGFGPKVDVTPARGFLIFSDSDGDLVTIKVSKGTLSRKNLTLGSDGTLLALKLSDPAFAGSDVTISAVKIKGGVGDGRVDVAQIDAHGIDLGKVSVRGRLGFILAGDAVVPTPGLKALTVGALGNETGLGTNDTIFHSIIVGGVGALTVKGSASGVDFEATGGALAGIGKITISGTLDPAGVIQGRAGYLHASGDIGPVKVAKGIYGGADFSGISAGGTLGKVTIGGALISFDPTRPVILSALGHPGATTDAGAVAIAGVNVRKNVVNARILAGYTPDLLATNPDAGIGPIMVHGFWTGSSVAAGVVDTTSDGFGRNDAAILPDPTPGLLSKIARLTIQGTATGSTTSGTFFGITAQVVGKVNIHGKLFPTSAGSAPLDLDSVNRNFALILI